MIDGMLISQHLPELHLMLGPGNDMWNHLEKRCPEVMKNLQSELNILKSDYQGKQKFEGNQVQKILNNLVFIKQHVPSEFRDIVDVLEALKEVKDATFTSQLRYCSPRPAPYYRNVVKNYEEKCQHVLSKYKISITNKSHVICSHVPDYIEEKGLSLGRTSDQLIENTHCQTNRIFTRSHYYVKDLNSKAHKKN